MPHLAPMSWIMSIMLFWVFMMLLTSSMWWATSNMFMSKMTQSTLKSQEQWNWYL